MALGILRNVVPFPALFHGRASILSLGVFITASGSFAVRYIHRTEPDGLRLCAYLRDCWILLAPALRFSCALLARKYKCFPVYFCLPGLPRFSQSSQAIPRSFFLRVSLIPPSIQDAQQPNAGLRSRTREPDSWGSAAAATGDLNSWPHAGHFIATLSLFVFLNKCFDISPHRRKQPFC